MSRYFSLCCSANAVANAVLEPNLIDHIVSAKITDISNIAHVAKDAVNNKITDISNIAHVVSVDAINNKITDISNITHVAKDTVNDKITDILETSSNNIAHLHLYDISMNIFEPN